MHTYLGNNLSYLEFKNIFAALFPFSFSSASPSQATGISALDFETNLYLYHSRGEPSGNYNPSPLIKSTKLYLQTLTLFWGFLFASGGDFVWFLCFGLVCLFACFVVWLRFFWGGGSSV